MATLWTPSGHPTTIGDHLWTSSAAAGGGGGGNYGNGNGMSGNVPEPVPAFGADGPADRLSIDGASSNAGSENANSSRKR